MKLLVIFPCYNEEEVLSKTIYEFFHFFEELVEKSLISSDSRICFVDDGSKDQTWNIIMKFTKTYIRGIKLSNNFGHQKALLAGLEKFKDEYDTYVTLDVDLQDDYHITEQMIIEYNKGFDIVYGVRNDRSSDSMIKRKTAGLFYTLMNHMGVNIIPNHADFRLLSKKALTELLRFPETHLFLRAVFPAIGLSHTIVYYKRMAREEGNSKYPFRKMLSFAWDGITSFSATPLRMVLLVGLFSIILSIILLFWATLQLLLAMN